MLTKPGLLRSAALAAVTVAATAHAQTTVDRPGLLETKAIAEEGFIYGLPHRDELRGDVRVRRGHEVQPVQGALQPDQQHAPRRDLRRHGGRHAEQRHALLDALAGSARRADGDLGAGGGEGALLLGAVDRRQYLQLRLHRQPRHGERAGRLPRRRPRLERRNARGHQEGLFLDDALRARRLSDPALQSRRHAERGEGAGGLQGAAAFRVPQATRAAGRAEDRFPPGQHARGSRRTSTSISTPPSSSSRRRRKTRRSGPSSPASASGRARPSTSRISRRNTRPRSCRA